MADSSIPRCLTTGRSSAISDVPKADSNRSLPPAKLIISDVAWSTSKPASASRLTARSTMSASEKKLATVSASALTPGSNIDTSPSDCGEASAKIRSGNPPARLRLDLLGFSDAMIAPGEDTLGDVAQVGAHDVGELVIESQDRSC